VFIIRSTNGNGKVVRFWSLVQQGSGCQWLLVKKLEQESQPFQLKIAEVIGQNGKPVITLTKKH
jgi:hypothetical protein